jgi:hypothetical protein
VENDILLKYLINANDVNKLVEKRENVLEYIENKSEFFEKDKLRLVTRHSKGNAYGFAEKLASYYGAKARGRNTVAGCDIENIKNLKSVLSEIKDANKYGI